MFPHSMTFAFGIAVALLGDNVAATSPSTRNVVSAEFNQINSTHITLSLANTGPDDLTLFGQNSIYDGAVPAWVGMSHTVNGTQVYLRDGQDSIRTIYYMAGPEDLISFPAGSALSFSFDATTAFEIPYPGEYVLSFADKLPVVTNSTDLNHLTFNYVSVDYTRLEVKVAASEPSWNATLGKRTWFNSNCNYDTKIAIDHMLTYVTQYAESGVSIMQDVIGYRARGINVPVWDLYFNNEDTSTVLNAFSRLATYKFPKDDNLDMYCVTDPLGRNRCDDRRVAFASRGPIAYIVFCDKFFNLPLCLNCDARAPGHENQQVIDQVSTVMHELLHIRHIVKATIDDGPYPTSQVYTYDGVIELARAQRLPGTDYPQRTATSYIYFLYTAMKLLRGPAHVNSYCHGICVMESFG